jgi:hypothetical protein
MGARQPFPAWLQPGTVKGWIELPAGRPGVAGWLHADIGVSMSANSQALPEMPVKKAFPLGVPRLP